MKIKISIVAIVVLMGGSLLAQSGEFLCGMRYAMGVSSIESDALADPSEKLAFSGGITGRYFVSESFYLQADVLGSWKGAKNEGRTNSGSDVFGNPNYRDYDESFKMVDIEIPLMGQIQLLSGNLRLTFGAGLATNFNLIGLQSRVYENQNYDDENGFDNVKMQELAPAHFSHLLSAGLNVKSADGRIYYLDVRNVGALSDFGDIENDGAQHRRLEIGIGFYL